ncbi:Similar to Abhd16a: Phosphatidylserine lipase ABHD16A (Rattus norvegicus) [Cotesia congregata]|uniref:Similar to Abhd16a: Phosphatidylserine lipase ABHD16A (Rattus norvegicus) n=1 Tax=Cotesia congregata TaxID=51543 RepID=A0A8J2MKP0_COTCN|nr:Similar to Abhd16a: Phosphatidylserine lipase ABHD16A (Rattus norvegicus) [Cotesia congregata]
MSLLKTIWGCLFSPRLYKYQEITWKSYEPNGFERWGDHVVTSFATLWSLSIWAVPIISPFIFRRSYSLIDSVYTISRFVAGAGVIFIASLAVRGYARANNPTYLKFIKTLTKAQQAYNQESKEALLKYDFQFWAWPVDFEILSINRPNGKTRIVIQNSSRLARRGGKDLIMAVPCKIVSYIVANTVAIRLMYPGSLTIINFAMQSPMLQGRMDMLDAGGSRSKLRTVNKNDIDTMFIDRRHKSSNGHILVITCEGNCGFYETGIMTTPMNKGYSGSPFPDAEIDGMEAVMRYAVEKLGFPEERIIVYGWSIGGYTATWAAMNYPGIHGLVLDATFDDVLPLAISRMPAAIDGIVRTVIREYLNLNVVEQLKRYDGRVLLVRRTDDEIMCTPTNNLSDNRGNILLTKLLMYRYPNLLTKNTPATYPSSLGEDCDTVTKQQLVIYLANKYMEDQVSQHCSPLITELFHPGWDPLSTFKLRAT